MAKKNNTKKNRKQNLPVKLKTTTVLKKRDKRNPKKKAVPLKRQSGSGIAGRNRVEEALLENEGHCEHKRAEADRTRFMTAIEFTTDAIVVTDINWVILYVNAAFEHITGYAGNEVLGRRMNILRSGKHDALFYDEINETLKNGKIWSGRIVNKKKDGALYEEDTIISPIKAPSGEVVSYVSVKRDVTERLKLESIAEAVNTMDNIGYVFAGIRHEIGNPVNSTKMTLNVLKKNIDRLEKADVMDYIERALGELSRIEYLLKNLKSFNMFERPEPKNVEITSFMNKFLLLIRGDFSLKKKIDIESSIDPGADFLYADPRALQQVLLNIFTNAADALEGRENPKIGIMVSKLSDMILIRVEDNGCGMTEDQVVDIFKPFCTTKKHGTGLGLTIVKKMLSYMNAFIEVDSKKEIGTTVEIFIPKGHDEG